MRCLVFLGPTLSAAEALARYPGAEVHPPAACGDVYRAVQSGFRNIALVDGYFDHTLSVWHKEILWALSRGVAVYGAASMGALRATELAPFGMVGVGTIFADYQRGAIDADDEVAVLHEGAERGYRVLSDALVNVRATLRQAMTEGAIDGPTQEQLLRAGKSLFYPHRTYAAIVTRAVDDGLSTASASQFQAWLGPKESRKVDQKQLDALELLETLRSASPTARESNFHFEYTEAWHELVRRNRGPASRPAPGGDRSDGPRQNPQFAALERALALEIARRGGVEADDQAAQLAADEFRRIRGLLTPEATERWLQARGIDLETFSLRMRDRATAQQFAERARHLAQSELDWVLDEQNAAVP